MNKILKILAENNAKITDNSRLPDSAIVDILTASYQRIASQAGKDWSLFEYKENFASVPTTRKKVRQ
jgi:hypothetical protein